MAFAKPRLVAFSVALYLLVVLGVYIAIRQGTGGHFAYSLDDPYIHLAVAEQLGRGHYGINPGEVASPSSSLLWPLLLVPLANSRWQLYLPLLWNILAGVLSAVLIAGAVAEWPAQPGESSRRSYLSVLALLLTGNLIGLTFLGMEHGLQVMLAICCAFCLSRALAGEPVPRWGVAAAALAPAVRYECLTLTLAVGIVLVAEGRRRLAAVLALLALTPLLAFSLFLQHHGLPLLPVSVLVKGKAAAAHTSAPLTVLRLMASGTFHALTDPARWPLVLLALILSAAAWRERAHVRRYVLAGAAVATWLHLLFGRFGWFHRYEISALIFAALITLRLIAEDPPQRLGWYALGLLTLAAPYASAIGDSVLSAEDVYHQQYQMHRFATEFYRGNVAVNDLGLVSYRLGPGRYVLDLGGLASLDTASEPNKTAAWLQGTVVRHHVGLVMIYPGLLPIPATWTKLGTVCNQRPPVALGGPCVDYFSSDSAKAAALATSFSAFAKSLPTGTAATVSR